MSVSGNPEAPRLTAGAKLALVRQASATALISIDNYGQASLPQPEDGKGAERAGGREEVAAMGVSGGSAPPVFPPGTGVLDPATLSGELAVVAQGAFSSAASGDADPDACFQLVMRPVGIITFVARPSRQVATPPRAPAVPWDSCSGPMTERH